MKTSFTPEEVSAIEDNAYDLGIVIGAREERERIIALIKPLGCEFNGVEHDCNVSLKDYTANKIIQMIRGY